MKIIATVLGMNLMFSNVIFQRFVEGGIVGTTIILICSILAVFFTIKAFLNLKSDEAKFLKYKMLINQIVLLALVISFLNSLLGLIGAFDALEASGGVEPEIVAGGLKITLLSPIFGLLVFILGYTATFVLGWIRKSDAEGVK
ncbi:hypothetical protein [Algoriphagus machipongonensis]|uniref:MotA/TolQ/ExbB proton channel domain-containing protein n=1 Tax=Algoriphagus machipongonensis TaxID=388413 RepID=A3HZV8_9BACT|nr:hypothetical protein [Algoriphagus machipongonensis]EAZ80794.1 hypothetical protein ALPR1_07710 [Algoriphagus machipongonensis]